jgi:hypothetical protein
MATIYCDEAGFTGNNLLDGEQEHFVFGSVAIEPDAARLLAEQVVQDFRLEGSELKGSRLLKTKRGRSAISFLLARVAPSAKLVVHLKKFALASKFFEYIFEPTFSDCNSLYYEINFHQFISNIMYVHFVASPRSAEQLFEEFSQMMRSLDSGRMAPFSPGEVLRVNSEDVMKSIALFAFLNRRHSDEELASIRGHEGFQHWVLDLTTTSLYAHLCSWGERFEVLEVYCDNSKPLEGEVQFFNGMVGRRERISMAWPGSREEHQVTFNLARPIDLVDSSQCSGIQIADVLASTAAWSLKERESEDARKWLDILAQCGCAGSVVPDTMHVDLTQREPFINALVLQELVNRSLKRENLCRGMPEFIATAYAAYEVYPPQMAEDDGVADAS